MAALNAASATSRALQAPFRVSPATRLAWIAGVLYLVYALVRLDFNSGRFASGLANGARFISRMFPPDLGKWDVLGAGIAESLQMAILASAAGILLSLPIGLAAARNLMPAALSWPARALISACRALHPVIVAILFVKAVGFGALAGILSLVVASIGFIGKLFADAIEEISARQVEAVRATGASFMNVILFGVLPQVLARFVGFATYQLDSNLRNSTMVGIVGAGGIGGALFSAFQRFDYDFVCTILITIVLIIVAGEILTNHVKRVFRV